MPMDDNELEKYLGEFQPRTVRALETSRPKAMVWMGRLAAALVIAFVLAGSAWFALHSWKGVSKTNLVVEQSKQSASGGARKKLPIIQLTKLAVEDPERLDALLAELPRHGMSVSSNKKGMLSTLAKE